MSSLSVICLYLSIHFCLCVCLTFIYSCMVYFHTLHITEVPARGELSRVVVERFFASMNERITQLKEQLNTAKVNY